MKTDKSQKSPMCRLCSALGTAILMALILLCIPFTLPRFLGYQAYAVVSGSMEPAISTGSLVYVKGMEPEEVRTGEVIAYYGGRDQNSVITHRVVENRVDEKAFITKGDANRTVDMNAVKYDFLIGRVEFSVPGAGIIAQLMTSTKGKIAAGCMIGLAVILHLLATMLDRFR